MMVDFIMNLVLRLILLKKEKNKLYCLILYQINQTPILMVYQALRGIVWHLLDIIVELHYKINMLII